MFIVYYIKNIVPSAIRRFSLRFFGLIASNNLSLSSPVKSRNVPNVSLTHLRSSLSEAEDEPMTITRELELIISYVLK
jgi:hypothetical protein